MRTMLACAFAVLISCSLEGDDKKDEKIDGKKLVGDWEAKDLREGVSVWMEFTKEGKVTFTYIKDRRVDKWEGTYKLDGDKLSITRSRGGKKDELDPITVTKLTDSELVTKENGREQTFTRLKGK